MRAPGRRFTFAAAAAALLLAPALSAKATPYYSVQAGHACNDCHIEPVGWKRPASWRERRCTLDCQACHLSPTGGGMRSAAGLYFGKTALAMGGERPGAGVDPEKYRSPGDRPVESIPDRFGDIAPDPRYGVGADLMGMAYFGPHQQGQLFPVQADLYGAWRPADRVLLYSAAGLEGNEARSLSRETYGNPGSLQQVAVRDLFLQSDGHPGRAWLRAGRFDKPHGWLLTDYTSYVRGDEGFGPESQVFGVEAGLAPGVPYASLDLFRQGVAGWPGEDLPSALPPGYGGAVNAGFRWRSGQVGLSADAVSYLDGGGDYVVGPIWAVNAWPAFVYLGEVDFKRAFRPYDVPALQNTDSLYAYDELDIPFFQGLVGQVKYDYEDPDTALSGDELHRLTVGVVLDPWNHTQLWVEWRRNYASLYFDLGRGVLVGPPRFDEVLVMGHLWI